MKLYEALDIDFDRDELLCFVGAGGKTTAMFRLARELRRYGKRVLVTTTTAIFYPDKGDFDKVVASGENNFEIPFDAKEGSIVVYGREVSHENKLLGVDKTFIERLYGKKEFDYILVEGDGSKRRPVKAPAIHEPVIPCNTTKVAGVIGLDALGKKIDDKNVHRPEIFSRVTGAEPGDVIYEDVIGRLIVSREGLFKAVPGGCRKYLILNKAKNRERTEAAMRIIDLVKKDDVHITGFIVADMVDDTIKII